MNKWFTISDGNDLNKWQSVLQTWIQFTQCLNKFGVFIGLYRQTVGDHWQNSYLIGCNLE